MKKIILSSLLGIFVVAALVAASPDLNSDGIVNGFDLGMLLGAWGNVTNNTAFADLNGDSKVNNTDLNILLSNWGPYSSGSDLVISDLSYSTTRDMISVTATAKNVGNVMAGENSLAIEVNGEQASASISQLVPGQEFTLQWTFNQAPAKGMQISAFADAFDQVTESNEDNNNLSIFIGK